MESARAAQVIDPLTRLALGERELAAGLRALAAESTSRRLQRDLSRVAGRIESGATLPQALEAAPALCPSYVRELLATGAESNRLPVVLLALGRHQRRTAAVRQRLRSTILYPVVLLSLLALGSVFLLLFVAAPIKEMLLAFESNFGIHDVLFARSGVDRLWPYRWGLLAAAALSIVAAALVILHQGVGRLGFAVRRLPMIGPVWRWLAWSQTLDLWAVYLRGSIPLPRALELTARALGDPALGAGHRRWAQQIALGQPLAEVLREDSRVPPTVAALLAWGDAQGALPEAVESAAEYCRDRLDSQLAFVEAAVPPLAFMTMIVGVAYLYSMLLALLRALQALT